VAPTAIDIIVPVYKSVALTKACLESLAAHLEEIAAYSPRLIVINDSPGEADVSAMLAGFAQGRSDVILLENDTNQGFIRTVNRGLQMAIQDGRDAILVNADTQTFPDALRQLVEVAYADPQIGFVSPRSNNASLCSLPHVHGGTLPTPEQAHANWKRICQSMPAYHFVPTAVGFYLYIKHQVLANFAPLDVSFGAGYEEENDLILRANKVGYCAVLANHAFAYHAGSASFSLTHLNLDTQRHQNLETMTQRHPEFLPLVRRYERSAHFRAERLLGHLPLVGGRIKIVFDLSMLGDYVNGTSEQCQVTLARLCGRHAASFDVCAICSPAIFKFHGFDKIPGLRRQETEPLTSERFAIAVRIGQPFDVNAVSVLEELAPINVFGMLDTIAEDCGYLSLTHRLDEVWRHAARHCNGLFFISQFSEQTFLARYPEARSARRYARLLPTRLSDYRTKTTVGAAEHVMIAGNHFAHKASLTTAKLLHAAFPTVQFVVLAKDTRSSANVRVLQSGKLPEDQIDVLYARASVVVLPSYVEGFGFGLPRALAAGKVVVARDIPATREILSTYRNVRGVFLYRNDKEMVEALKAAMAAGGSEVDDTGAPSWDDWVDGFVDHCLEMLRQPDVFRTTVERIRSGDLLRGAENGRSRTTVRAVSHVQDLLALDGEEFVQTAYVTVLGRDPDSEGMQNYLRELEAGIGKLAIVSRLRGSEEGREKARRLHGFRRARLGLAVRDPLRAWAILRG
jgi:GT2 family glycosyltransferase